MTPETKGRILDIIPDSWGQKCDCADAAVAFTQLGPNSVTMKTEAYCFLTFFNAQPERRRALNSDRTSIGYCPPASIEIVPIHSDLFASWSVYKENLFIGVSHAKMKGLTGCEYDIESFELFPPAIGTIDRESHRLALRMRREMQASDVGHGESIDALLTLFSVHVLRNYSSLGKNALPRRNGGLSPVTRKRVHEYILVHLREKITLQNLADVACLSPSHFSRAFRMTMGQSPYQYIMGQRLSTAKELLLAAGPDVSLEDIAKLSGFASNSHLSTSMKNAWGLTPTQVRRKSAHG